MKADYEHRIAAVNQDFTVKMKNREHDYEQQYDKLAKRHKEEMEELIDKVNERELKLNQSIEERDEQIKKIQMTMKTETDDKTKLQEMIEKWSLPKEKPSMKIAETKDEPSWKTKTNTHTGQGSKRQDGPLPPKMSTYDGRSDWRPYLVQFNHIANRYNWTNQDRLDKLIECLRDRALKFFTTMPKSVQEGYQAVCKKMEDRFGRKDLPHVIRRQLQDLRQLPEEPLDEYAERTQDLATDGFPGTPDDFIQIVATDAFLKGCMDKKAALTAMDKDPDSLDKALKYVKSAVTNQKVILGNKKPEVKGKGASDTDVISRFESRLKKTEEDVQDTKTSIKQILDILKRGNSTNRFGQPQRLSSPGRSPIRDNKCFNCGEEGHFIAQCEKPKRVNSKKTFGVIDTAAQVSVISKTFFDQLTYKPKIKGNIILKGAGACSEINAGIAENVNLDIGSSTVKWDMVVAEITDNLILGIDFLESQKAIIDLTDYSIKLKGEKVPSFMTSNRQDQQMKIYRIKIKKKTVIPPGSSKVAIVELDEKPMNDIVIQPTNFMKGLLVPNMLCMGKKQVPVMLRNPTEQFKTLKKDFQMGIGLEINAVMEETDENSLKLNKIDITPKQSFGLNQLREKLPTHLKELFNRSLANLNNQQAGKKHINADGLSRIPDDIEACRNYRPDVNLEELPCGGCKFCTRARQQWQTFEEEVDFVVPLTIRRLVDDGSYNTNWTPSYSPVELHEEQMKDSDLKTLKRWIEDKYEPTKAELKLGSEVVRHFWSLRQQIQIKDNILLYKWEDPISPRLLFMAPKQMQKELLHGCHDVVSSGHMGQYKTLEKLKQIAVWFNMTQSCKLMRNQLMDQTMDEETNEIYECPIGLPDIFKENTNVMSSSDPLMSHFIGDAAIVGAPDPLVSHTVSNSTSSENKALTDICEKNINGDLHVHEMDASAVESDMLSRRRHRKKPAYLSDYVED
ncbi:unnamed protein product [Mytilus edulis]|uniref:CCHC-type domain-containing protein n=1 Tax=Mytilus edulis TaxID=6550 RepID=A0A8S3PUV1_MYTED|nr:unnamed protein product [Mytilus edulis]